MATKNANKASRYFTHSHNIDGCLENGSYVRQDADGKIVQYMNGDYMGEIARVPGNMTEVPFEKVKELLPSCCR